MSWWEQLQQLVGLCTLLACNATGAEGRWVTVEWVFVMMTPVWIIVILWVQTDDDGDGHG